MFDEIYIYFILILYSRTPLLKEKEAKCYKMKRPSHTQFRHKYCKESGEDTEKKNWKETEDTRGEDQF